MWIIHELFEYADAHFTNAWISVWLQIINSYWDDHVMTEPQNDSSSKWLYDRVLALILLGGVEVLPTVYPPNPGVMGGLCESRSCDDDYRMLTRNQVGITDAVTLEFMND